MATKMPGSIRIRNLYVRIRIRKKNLRIRNTDYN